jgi:hypothetical protein
VNTDATFLKRIHLWHLHVCSIMSTAASNEAGNKQLTAIFLNLPSRWFDVGLLKFLFLQYAVNIVVCHLTLNCVFILLTSLFVLAEGPL